MGSEFAGDRFLLFRLITLVRSLGYSIFTRTFLQGSATHSKVESTRFKNQARMNSRNPHNI
uniref:Uncharacterized protein n=1 Tax=Helianthus annuus TaxID=4232 RepID=A0A251U425_HELAN